MTVSSTTTKVSFSGNGSTTAFAVGFYFLANAHLKVTLRSSNGTETLKVLNTDYTVAGAGVPSGGTVTMGTAPATGETLFIQRNAPLTQLVDYQPNDPFPANTHEMALDQLTMEVQQLNEAINRSIKVSTTNTITTTEFTVGAADRANKVLGFDTNGDLVVTQELGTYRGNWTGSTSYSVRDIIKDTSNANIYICVTAHTSSGAQPISTNTDSAKWSLIVDAASAASSATAAAASASAASTSATNAATSASAAATSASTASTQASNASTSASNASTSASSASSSASAASSSASAASSSAAAAAAAAASGLYRQVIDKSADYTIVAADGGSLIRGSTGSGVINFTLPQISTVTDGFKVSIVKWTSDSNAINVNRSGSDTINGGTTVNVGSQYAQIILVADFETNTWFASQSGLGATNKNVDAFSGNGSTTAFTLSIDPVTKNNTDVYIAGVHQAHSTYSVSGTTLTFSTAPPSGTNNIQVVYGTPLAIGTPSDGTVTPAKLSTGYPYWNTLGYLGINNTNPQKELHAYSTQLTGATLRFENSNTSMAVGNSYGQIEWFGNDNSTNANGVRAKIEGYSAGTTGAAYVRILAAAAGSTTLQLAATFFPGTISVNSGSFSNANTTGYFLNSGTFYQSTRTQNVTTVTMINTDTQVDVDITGFMTADISKHYILRVSASCNYQDNSSTPAFATSARMFKEWTQGIVWNGTTWVINGAALIGTGYTSDGTNLAIGAVNASKALVVVSTTQVLIRLQNRTSPAASSATQYAVHYEILSSS